MRKAITLLLGMSLLVATPVVGQSAPPRGAQQGMRQVPDSVSGRGWHRPVGWDGGMMGMPMMGMGYRGMVRPGRMGGAGMGMMLAYGLPSPGVILGMQDDLGLTDAQVSQLESLRTNVRETLRADLTSARQARQEAASMLESKTPDLQAYEQKLQEAATDQVHAQVAVANASVEARGILTPEQSQKVQDGISMLHGMVLGGGEGSRSEGGTIGWNPTP